MRVRLPPSAPSPPKALPKPACFQRGTASGPIRFGHMVKDAAQCRRHAEFCRRVASKSLPPLAAEFNRMAEVWAKQAEELERQAQAAQSMDGDQNGRRRGEGRHRRQP